MSNLLFIRRSLQLRHAAIAAMRNARAMPVGAERTAARRLARGLKECARTEAWLEGQSSLESYGPRPRRSVARSAAVVGA
jgi:hypothetical protein